MFLITFFGATGIDIGEVNQTHTMML